MSISRFIVFISIVLYGNFIYAKPVFKFFRYTQNDGLVNNDVLSICQDSIGYIWIGTKNGCSRFDGMNFTNYKVDDGQGTIGPGWIKQIILDDKGRLWFVKPGDFNNFSQYDYKKDVFIDRNTYISSSINAKNIYYSIFNDSKGNLWLGTRDGPLTYNHDSLKVNYFKEQRENNPLFSAFSLNIINEFCEDRFGNIWMATNIGVFIYVSEEKIFRHIKNEPQNNKSLSSENCSSIFQDSENTLWIGTSNGLNKVAYSNKNADTIVFERMVHDPNNGNSLSSNMIYDINEDNKKNLLIATVHGLCALDKKNGNIYRYFHDELDPESLISNIVRTIYKDKKNNIWIGTSHGICKLKNTNFFTTYTHSAYKNSLSHNKVMHFCEAPGSKIWIATPNGIDVFNRKTGLFDLLFEVSTKKNELNAPPVFLYPIDKKIWIGTYRGGIYEYNMQSRAISNKHFLNSSVKFRFVPSMLIDSRGYFWVCDYGLDLFVFLPGEKSPLSIPWSVKDSTTLSSYLITSIMEDSDSTVWVCTIKGLNKVIDIRNGICHRYLNKKKINHIIEREDKKIWIATDGGLFYLDKKNDKFKLFNSHPSLKNSINSIIEDSKHNLWLSSNIGIMRLCLTGDSLESLTVFSNETGLPSGYFIDNSCYSLSDGAILFGSTNGFCMFHPNEVSYDTIAPKIVFTDFKIRNKTVKPGQEINSQIVLYNAISLTNRIVLNDKNNDFSIEFAGLNSNIPQKNQYFYRLRKNDGNNPEWTTAQAHKSEAKFMNLPQGKYIFQVNCTNGYGVKNQKTAELYITILPPWWKTLWFRLLSTVILTLTFFILLKLRTYNLQKQKQKLELLVKERTIELQEMNTQLEERQMELEQQTRQMEEMNESLVDVNTNLELKTKEVEIMANKVHEADQKQLRFFANISHEFRTPLSLIISPLDKLRKMTPPFNWQKINTYHNLMHKNAQRMLRLTNQLIDFRKMDQNRVELITTNNNIVNFIEEVVKAFGPLAEAKSIHLSLTSGHLSKNIDHSKLNKENLTENRGQTYDEKFENNNLSNEEDQMQNDKWSMINDFWFDPDIMEKILYNLISNAIKYTPGGGEILISIGIVEMRLITSLQNQLTIKISDTGIGIKPKNLDNIFDRFYMVETHGHTEGTGIGLAYTKELVLLHGGTITVDSEWGKGTSFHLAFPLNKAMQASKNQSENAYSLAYTKSMVRDNIKPDTGIPDNIDSHQSKNAPQLLIVEDNEDMLHYITCEFIDIYNTLQAHNGKQGVEMAIMHNPDLIISDVMMPEMNGLELVQTIKNDGALCHIPVILLTAKTGEEETLSGLRKGADDYLNKPFNIDILKAKVENILSNRKLLQQKFKKSFSVRASEFSNNHLDQNFLDLAIKTVEDNMSNPDYSLDDFIKKIGYSRNVVYKKIKSLTNQSVSDFIRNIKLKKAAGYLLTYKTEKTISEIAFMVGFKHRENFSRYFSAEFGMSPSEFRDKN